MKALIVKYETDVKYGIPPEAALLESYLSSELAKVFQWMADMGVLKQLPLHSITSQYGQLTRTWEFDDRHIKEFMEKQAQKIKNGEFAKELELEQKRGYSTLKKMYNLFEKHKMIQKEQKLLSILKNGH